MHRGGAGPPLEAAACSAAEPMVPEVGLNSTPPMVIAENGRTESIMGSY